MVYTRWNVTINSSPTLTEGLSVLDAKLALTTLDVLLSSSELLTNCDILSSTWPLSSFVVLFNVSFASSSSIKHSFCFKLACFAYFSKKTLFGVPPANWLELTTGVPLELLTGVFWPRLWLSDVVEGTVFELFSTRGRRGVTTGLRPATSSLFFARAAFLAWVRAKSFWGRQTKNLRCWLRYLLSLKRIRIRKLTLGIVHNHVGMKIRRWQSHCKLPNTDKRVHSMSIILWTSLKTNDYIFAEVLKMNCEHKLTFEKPTLKILQICFTVLFYFR